MSLSAFLHFGDATTWRWYDLGMDPSPIPDLSMDDLSNPGWADAPLPIGQDYFVIAGTNDHWTMPTATPVGRGGSPPERWFWLAADLPEDAALPKHAEVWLRYDFDGAVYYNGALLANIASPNPAQPSNWLPYHPVAMPRERGGRLAFLVGQAVRAGADGFYLDVALAGYDDVPVTRKWPRDSHGFAAAPRLHPPSRIGRVVGGQP